MPIPTNDPLFQMGMGILGGSGPGTSIADSARGGMMGLNNVQRQQKVQQEMELRRQALEIQRQNMMQPDLTNIEKMLVAAGMQPGTPEFQQAVMQYAMQPKAPNTTLKIHPAHQETEEQKYVGKMYGQMFEETQKSGLKAQQELSNLSRMENLFRETYTGQGANALLSAKKLGAIFGLDFEGIGEAEAGNALASEMALQLRSTDGGAGMPGAMSDKDREFLMQMTPGLATSEAGRTLMIETRRRKAKRSVEVSRMARAYRKKHGMLDEGFYDQLAQYSAANPLFDDLNYPAEAPVPTSNVVKWSDL